MSARRKALDFTTYTLDAANKLAELRSFNFDIEALHEDGRSVDERYQYEVATKKRARFNAEHQMINTNEVTNLDVSVYTRGGTNYLGNLREFGLNIQTETDEGSGVADLFEYPNSVGTSLSISAKELIPAADLSIAAMSTMNEGNVTNLPVTIAATIGAAVLSFPCLYTRASHGDERIRLTTLDIDAELRGTPSASGHAMLVSVLTGTSVVAYAADTKKGNYSGDALIASADIRVRDASIVTESYEMLALGAPTLIASV